MGIFFRQDGFHFGDLGAQGFQVRWCGRCARCSRLQFTNLRTQLGAALLLLFELRFQGGNFAFKTLLGGAGGTEIDARGFGLGSFLRCFGVSVLLPCLPVTVLLAGIA